MTYAFDPELAPLVALLPHSDFSDVAAARAGLAAMIDPLNEHVDTTGVDVTDRVVSTSDGDVRIRVYVPSGPPPATGRPALLDIHGGGFAVGSITMQHAFATGIARGSWVRSSWYRSTGSRRRTPSPPASTTATRPWAGCTTRVRSSASTPCASAWVGRARAVGSRAATALLARDRGGPPVCFQFLGIPELDHRLETTSMRTFLDTPLWNRPSAVLSWRYYLGEDPNDVSPYASPAIAEDLRGLPPAYVTTMEFDPLRDEGILYALRMMEAGVPVELHSFPGTFHGSAMVPAAAVSRRANAELIEVLRRGLGT